MKFSYSLEYNSIQEWAGKYINYEKLKAKIYEIEKQLAISFRQKAKLDDEQGLLTDVVVDIEDEDTTRMEKEFSKMFLIELDRVNGFYIEKEAEFKRELESILLSPFLINGRPIDGISFEERRNLREKAKELYINLCSLKDYVVLNYSGFSKILKKFDKVINKNIKAQLLPVVESSSFWKHNSDMVSDGPSLNDLIRKILLLYKEVCGVETTEQASDELAHHLREFVTWERNTVWKDMIGRERKAAALEVKRPRPSAEIHRRRVKLPFFGFVTIEPKIISLIICIIVFFIIISAKFFNDKSKDSCLALFFLASALWALEIFPLFATAILIPFMAVALNILQVNGQTLPAKESAKLVMSHMFSPVIMLLLGGFTIAAALSKYNIAKGLATFILSKAGTKSNIVLLAVMFVATFASMWLSNVAAPVLCFSVIEPILRTLEPDNKLAKSLILGIALASNIGGMMSPVSSPQNAIGLGYMDPPLSWLSWLSISIPMSVASNLVCWTMLLFTYQPSKDTPVIQAIRPTHEKWSLQQFFVVFVSLAVIVLWCLSSLVENFFGHSGIIGVIPMILFFGTGILSKEDFNNFLWTVVILAMGGSVLGFSIENSGLLSEIASFIKCSLGHANTWVVTVSFCSLVLVAATFISHTVSAIIVLPIVSQVGSQLPGGHVNLIVMSCVLMCSAAMGLPISGFPNITAISLEDVTGRPYLRTRDFLLVGVPVSIFVCLLTVTLGYGIMMILGI